MLEFHKKKSKNPSKTEPEKRIKDFQEIYSQFDKNDSIEQSSRCSQCGIPYCQIHCPLNNNIPDWLRYIAEGRLEEAYQVSASTNAFPEVCGRVCPQDRLCEGNCVVEQAGFGAITIGNLEKYLTEIAWEKGWVKNLSSQNQFKQKVAIIGSGPAGMAASAYLTQNGYQVDVFEKNDRAGGLMIYGIPNFKLDKKIVERRTEWLLESGVKFNLNMEVGKNISFHDLEKDYDAILIAKGKVQNTNMVVGAQDFRFIGGSFGAASGEAFIAGAQQAIENNIPYIFFSCSGGQRMHESSIALMQMSRTALAVNEIKKKNIPFIVILTNPTTGGVTASWAMLGDILISEPKSVIGFAGRRVIQDTVRETLPDDFQTAEYVKDHGGLDLIVERQYLNSTIGTLLNVLLKKEEARAKKESNVTVDQSLQSAS